MTVAPGLFVSLLGLLVDIGKALVSGAVSKVRPPRADKQREIDRDIDKQMGKRNGT